jgi:hypothetical protein
MLFIYRNADLQENRERMEQDPSIKDGLTDGIYPRPCVVLLVLLVATTESPSEEQSLVSGKQAHKAGSLTRQAD